MKLNYYHDSLILSNAQLKMCHILKDIEKIYVEKENTEN